MACSGNTCPKPVKRGNRVNNVESHVKDTKGKIGGKVSITVVIIKAVTEATNTGKIEIHKDRHNRLYLHHNNHQRL